MPRQQRTPYIRQKVQSGNPVLPISILWEIESVGGATVTLRLTNGIDGLVLKGVPPFRTYLGSIPCTGATLVYPPVTPGQEQLVLTFAAPLSLPDGLILEQSSSLLQNRNGGVLPAGVSSWPGYPSFGEPIFLSYTAHSGAQLDITLTSALGPCLIGPGFQLTNTTTGQVGLFGGFAGSDFQFIFTGPVSSGDEIAWADGGDSVRNQFHGGLLAGTFNVP